MGTLTIGDVIDKFVWNVLNNYIKNDNKNTLNMQHFNKHASYQKFDCCHELLWVYLELLSSQISCQYGNI
jgi:hypothetical protein